MHISVNYRVLHPDNYPTGKVQEDRSYRHKEHTHEYINNTSHTQDLIPKQKNTPIITAAQTHGLIDNDGVSYFLIDLKIN